MIDDPSNDSVVGPERSLMVKSLAMKRLRDERRLLTSELRALNRESQTPHVLKRKEWLEQKLPEIEKEMIELQRDLRKMLESGSEQLNPSGKYYILAEKLVNA